MRRRDARMTLGERLEQSAAELEVVGARPMHHRDAAEEELVAVQRREGPGRGARCRRSRSSVVDRHRRARAASSLSGDSRSRHFPRARCDQRMCPPAASASSAATVTLGPETAYGARDDVAYVEPIGDFRQRCRARLERAARQARDDAQPRRHRERIDDTVGQQIAESLVLVVGEQVRERDDCDGRLQGGAVAAGRRTLLPCSAGPSRKPEPACRRACRWQSPRSSMSASRVSLRRSRSWAVATVSPASARVQTRAARLTPMP